MKILYLSLAQIPSRSAHSIHIMRMCSALSANGHKVTLEVPDHGNDSSTSAEIFSFYGVKTPFELRVRETSGSKGKSTRFLIEAIREFRRMDGELVYTRDVAASFWATWLSMSTILETHSVFKSFQDKVMFQIAQNRKMLRSHVVISNRLRDVFDNKYPHSARKRFVAHDGADKVSDLPDIGAGIELAGKFKVGYVGHLYGGRGLELIGNLAEKLPFVMFYVVGGLEQDIVKWRQRFQDQENLRLMGYLNYRLAEQVRIACDVLIAPYQRGLQVFGGQTDTSDWMSPLKIFEYMAAGKPIVCSDLPSLREILSHGETGFLLDPTDLDQWVSTLQALRDDHKLRLRVGSEARRELERKYEWKVRAGNILAELVNA